MADWSGDELRRLLERKTLSRDELADLINQSLGTSYNGESVARWMRDRKPAAATRAFLDQLAVDPLADDLDAAPAAGLGQEDVPLEHEPAATGDTPPGPGLGIPTPAVGGRGAYTRACEELFEMIATGVGLVGAALNSPALMNDGRVILEDAKGLGAAYGKLAEQNETFRRMLVGMTSGGVWLQVAVVTGTTFSKCWQGHAAYAMQLRQQQQQAGFGDDDAEPVAA